MNITNRITFWVLVATGIVLIPTGIFSYWRTMVLLGPKLPNEIVQSAAFQIGASQIVIVLTSMLFLIVAFRLVARNIAGPICQLQKAALAIASGNLDVSIPETGLHDEVEALAGSFRTMQRDLKANIDSLAETMRSKEKLESELRIAHEIQMSLVPDRMPETPMKDWFDLSASMKTAKQVGGDFYDYFLLDDETLCLAIADVSGKGVPAALLMSRCSALFRHLLITNHDLAYTTNQVNRVICDDNNSCMFVTLFAVLVHLPSGNCRYINAGHNPPYINTNIYGLKCSLSPRICRSVSMKQAFFVRRHFKCKMKACCFCTPMA